MNQTHITGRDWSGLFSGRIEIKLSVGFGDIVIEDDFGVKFCSKDQVLDVACDSRIREGGR